MAKTDVFCVGAAITDVLLQPVSREIFDVDSYPIEQIGMTIGGDAINEATIISRLGHSVSLVAMVGDDAPGAFIQRAAEREGIDSSRLKVRDDVDTSINVGLVCDDGERTFVTNRNGSLWRTTVQDLNLDGLEDARLLSFASFFNNPLVTGSAMVEVFKRAKAAGLIICADMINPRLGETLVDIQEALSYVDYFFPNRSEAELLTGKTELSEIADVFLNCGVKNVIIKNGSHGCYVKNAEKSFEVGAVKGHRAIDTTGAGDNFCAGFITAILDGLDIEGCAKFANTTANLSTRAIGATTGVKSHKQVEDERDSFYGVA